MLMNVVMVDAIQILQLIGTGHEIRRHPLATQLHQVARVTGVIATHHNTYIATIPNERNRRPLVFIGGITKRITRIGKVGINVFGPETGHHGLPHQICNSLRLGG